MALKFAQSTTYFMFDDGHDSMSQQTGESSALVERELKAAQSEFTGKEEAPRRKRTLR